MTELTELLYDYALERSSIGLQSQEYREVSALAKQLEIRLRQELPPEAWDLASKYRDALQEQRDLEQEDLVRAALALARELSALPGGLFRP